MVSRTERLLRGLAAALALFVVAALVVTVPVHAKTRQYEVSPSPRWVRTISVDTNDRLPPNLNDGTAYLLVDRQIRIQDGHIGRRTVKRKRMPLVSRPMK